MSWHQIEIDRAQFRCPGIRSKLIASNFDMLAPDRNPSRPISISSRQIGSVRISNNAPDDPLSVSTIIDSRHEATNVKLPVERPIWDLLNTQLYLDLFGDFGWP